MERFTYEITFIHHDGEEEIQQHTSEALARKFFRMFDEPDSAELYTEIRLTEYDWETKTERLLDTLHF